MKKLIFSIGLFVFILLTGCGAENRINHIILLDISKSIDETSLQKHINVITAIILPNLQRNDKIAITLIDGVSYTKSERIFSLDLSEKMFEKKLVGMNKEKEFVAGQISKYINDTVVSIIKNAIEIKKAQREKESNYTDIIGSLKSIQSFLNYDNNCNSGEKKFVNTIAGYNNYFYKNNIYIFSDMINEDEEHRLNFNGMSEKNQGDISKQVMQLESQGQLPALKDCRIFVCGASPSFSTKVNRKKHFENIRFFGTQYFNKTGATVVAYGFDIKEEIQEALKNKNSN